MKYRILAIITGIFILIIPEITFGNAQFDSEYINLNLATSGLGMGGALSSPGDPATTFINDAAMGLLNRYRVSVNTLFYPSDYNFYTLGAGFKTRRGNFGLNVAYGRSEKLDDSYEESVLQGQIDHFVHGNILWSRGLTQNVFLGFGLRWIYAMGHSDSAGGAGADIGILYKFSKRFEKDYGWGMRNPIIHASLYNLGVGAKLYENNRFPGQGVIVGGALSPIRFETIEFRMSVDYFLSWLPYSHNLRIGTTLSLFPGKVVSGHLRFGANLFGEELAFKDSDGYRIGWWFAGAGISFEVWGLEWNIDYSFVPTQLDNDSTTAEYRHHLGLSIAFGVLDDQAPEIQIETNPPIDEEDNVVYISPHNIDEAQDEIAFDLVALDTDSPLYNYLFVIENSRGEVVYEDDGTRSEEFTFSLIPQMFAVSQDINIPGAISWNGIDMDGNPVPDGEYTYNLWIRDEAGNESSIEDKIIIVDNVPPDIQIQQPDYMAFSPAESPGQQDNLEIRTTTEPGREYVAQILDNEGNVVEEWQFRAQARDRIVWNGRNHDSDLVADGIYTFVLYGFDKAGNRNEQHLTEIEVDNTPPVVEIIISNE